MPLILQIFPGASGDIEGVDESDVEMIDPEEGFTGRDAHHQDLDASDNQGHISLDEFLEDSLFNDSDSIQGKKVCFNYQMCRFLMQAFPANDSSNAFNQVDDNQLDHQEAADVEAVICPLRLRNEMLNTCWFIASVVNVIHAKRVLAEDQGIPFQAPANLPQFQDGLERAMEMWSNLTTAYIVRRSVPVVRMFINRFLPGQEDYLTEHKPSEDFFQHLLDCQFMAFSHSMVRDIVTRTECQCTDGSRNVAHPVERRPLINMAFPRTSIQEEFQALMSPETPMERLHCVECLTPFFRRSVLEFVDPAQVLVISIARKIWCPDRQTFLKIDDRLQTGGDLNLATFNGLLTYRLISGIQHIGLNEDGHYVSHLRRGDVFHKVDGDHPVEISNSIGSCQMFFYKIIRA